ncbi:hypothetical protein RB595_009952 [Gaeumannomyces hyphopodioides]
MSLLRSLVKELVTAPFKHFVARPLQYPGFAPWNMELRRPPQMRVQPRRLADVTHEPLLQVPEALDEKIPSFASTLFIATAIALNVVAVMAFTTVPTGEAEPGPKDRRGPSEEERGNSCGGKSPDLPLTLWNQ